MELQRPAYLTKLFMDYKKTPEGLANLFEAWAYTPQVYRYKSDSSLFEGLYNVELSKVSQDLYKGMVYPALFMQIEVGSKLGLIEGFFAHLDDNGDLNISAYIPGENQELLLFTAPLNSAKATNLSKKVRIKRYRLKTKKEKLNGLVSLPVNSEAKAIFNICLKFLTDVCEPVPVLKKRPKIEYRGMPKRTNKPQPKEYKEVSKNYRLSSTRVRKPLETRIRYDAEYYKSGPGIGQGRPRRPCYVPSSWRWVPYGPRKNDKGESIKQEWKIKRIPGYYVKEKEFIENLEKRYQVPTIHNRK